MSMSTTHSPMRTHAAVLTIAAMLATSLAPAISGQAATPAAAAPATAAKSGAPAATPAPPDGGWPRAYTTASGAPLVALPAADRELGRPEAHGRVHRRSRTRRRARPSRRSAPSSSKRDTSVVARRAAGELLGAARSPRRTSRRSQREQLADLVEEIAAAIPHDERVIALDRVLANIDKSQIIPKNVEGVKADPPPIFFSKTPAVLVNIDGDPIWSPIQDNDLQVGGQHQLGSVPARPDQDVLPAQRQDAG